MLKVLGSFLFCAVLAHSAHALTAEEARGLAIGDSDARLAALAKAVENADDKTAAFIQALADDAVKVAGDKVFIVRDGKATDPASGAATALPDGAEDVVSNNRMRGELDNALAALKLFSPDLKLRREAVKALQGEADDSKLALVERALAAEQDAGIKAQLQILRASVLLASPDKARRLEAARLLAGSKSPTTKTVLIERLKAEDDAEVKSCYRPRCGPWSLRWPGATGWPLCSRASAWAPFCCWWHWAWRSPTV